ncbi:MAG: DNA replication/repair protein RecF [Selenomonas sp.]|nr:DNA replication/repair protein RecF [Selenomonas sp.]
MQVTALHLKNFRNYADLTLALSSGINIFLGANAQGKTNILEAICYASLGRSHRTHQDSDLIRFSEPAGILQLAFSRRDVPSRIDIQLPRKGRRKLVLNGQSIRPKDLVGSLNTVLFSPEDLFLIKGAPAGRRHFLDSEISQASPAYYHELLTYNRLLQQRNTLLKRIREHHASPALLAPWDPQLARSAAKITKKRQEAVKKLHMLANLMQRKISGSKENLSLTYEIHGLERNDSIFERQRETIRNPLSRSVDSVGSPLPPDTKKTSTIEQPPTSNQVTSPLESWYNKRLEERHELDILRGVTSVGPHRDDLAMAVNGIDLRAYGSQGQQRTGALALKLAELEFLRSETGEYPILLLDDVMSELDASRREALLAFLQREHIQTIVTATDAAYFPRDDFGTVYHVENGNVTKA